MSEDVKRYKLMRSVPYDDCAFVIPAGQVMVREADYDALREQNRVLRSNLVNCAARLEAYYGEDYPAVRDAKAALTATARRGSMDNEQRCGTCKWWVETRPYELGAMWPYSLGDCRFPMPFFLPQSETFSNAGEDCKAWHAK